MREFSKGDKVEWNYSSGTVRGHIVRKLTSDTEIGNHMVRASHDDPQYLVESEHGNQAAHKPSSLKKVK